jgi:hypothetical protein
MSSVKNISEDEFYEIFKPIQNHLDESASWDGLLFETFGHELDYCFELSNCENRVWTLVECDNDEHDIENIIDNTDKDDDDEPDTLKCLKIVSGFCYVNRLGFFITEIPYNDGHFIQVNLT